MGIFSRAQELWNHPLNPETGAKTLVGGVRNAVVNLFKLIPSAARAPVNAAVGAIKGTLKPFLEPVSNLINVPLQLLLGPVRGVRDRLKGVLS